MLDRFEVGILKAMRHKFAETNCDGRAQEATLSLNFNVVPLETYSRRVRIALWTKISGRKSRHRLLKSAGHVAAQAKNSCLNTVTTRHSLSNSHMATRCGLETSQFASRVQRCECSARGEACYGRAG